MDKGLEILKPTEIPAGPRIFVWTIWWVMFLTSLGFVRYYSRNVPYVDDWALVPYLTGDSPITLAYLWEQHNEHRIFIPKLVMLGLLQFTEGDFRGPIYFNLALMGLLSFTMIQVAGRIRGHTSYADVFFPLILLHWGHGENILWTIQTQVIISALFIGGSILIIVQNGVRPTLKSAFLLALLLGLLPLCGGYGLPFVLFLAFWLCYVGICHLRSNEPRGKQTGLIIIGLGIVALTVLNLYFLINYKNNPGDYFVQLNPNISSIVQTSLEVMAMSWGPAAFHDYTNNFLWPYSSILIIGLFVASFAALLAVFISNPVERNRALGLMLFLLAVVALIGGIGKARADYNGGQGFANRYGTTTVPALYCVYFVLCLYSPLKVRFFSQMSIFTLVCSLTILNTLKGMEITQTRTNWENQFLEDIAKGEPIYKLVRRYNRALTYEVDQESFAKCLHLLHNAKMGPFQYIRDNPPFREIQIPLEPKTVEGANWKGNTGYAVDRLPSLTFELPETRYVAGIRIKIRYANRLKLNTRYPQSWKGNEPSPSSSGLFLPWDRKEILVEGGLPRLQISWKTPEQAGFTETNWGNNTVPRFQDERYLGPGENDQMVIVWVADTIDRFRIYPDKPLLTFNEMTKGPDPTRFQPFTFTISEICLLEEDR